MIFGCTEELMNAMHSGRKITGQRMRLPFPFGEFSSYAKSLRYQHLNIEASQYNEWRKENYSFLKIFFGYHLPNNAHKNYSHNEVQAIPKAMISKQYPKAKTELATWNFSRRPIPLILYEGLCSTFAMNQCCYMQHAQICHWYTLRIHNINE